MMRAHIDSVTCRGKRFFGWGWALAARPLVRATLHIHYAPAAGGAEVDRFVCTLGLQRPDIANAFPDTAHAANAGMIFFGMIRPGREIRQAVLHAELSDGSHQQLSLPDFFNDGRRAGIGPAPRRGGLGMRLRWWLTAAPRWLKRRFAAPPTAAPKAPTLALPQTPAFLVFDHDMGGGANRYRQEMVQKQLAAGRPVVLAHPRIGDLSYGLRVLDGGGERHASIATQQELLALLAALPLAEIAVNSLIGFEEPGEMLEWARAARARSGARLFFPLHDFHAVCPSWTLLDQDGSYCGIPDTGRCATCLPRNPAMFNDIVSGRTIIDWRQDWLAFLAACDEIHVFSESSRTLLARAYPTLAPDTVKLLPHDVSWLRPQKITFARAARLTIGVIGTIGLHKGAEIVNRIAAIIAAEQLDIGLVVIGTLESAVIPANITITGPYDSGELAALLLRHQVNACLLPSIWPETFSYVTQEIMNLGMPLAVFDLGAPAERVRHYALGRVIPEIDARAALDGLRALHAAANGKPETGAPS